MPESLYESRILPAHRKRRYSILDAVSVQYHSGDDMRWARGVDAFRFGTTTDVIDLDACDTPASGDPDVGGQTNDGQLFLPFASLISVSCSTLSARGTLDEMKSFVAKEHEAILPHHLDLELASGSLSSKPAQGLSTLATALTAGTSSTVVSIGDNALLGPAVVENTILIPIQFFAAATEGKVYRDEDGTLRSYVGSIVVPFYSTVATAYVIPGPIKLHLSPKNLQIPRNWVNIGTNEEFASSEILGLFEFDPAVGKIALS